VRTRRLAAIGLALAASGLAFAWVASGPKRVAVVEPGRIVRGAWQGPGPLLSLIRRESIRTVVTLTAINRDDPKYVAQLAAVQASGVDWRIIPMRGSTATVEQMAEAADLVADPTRQPVFFHCVGGHHRTNLVHAAYLIRHQGHSADSAWAEVTRMPWTRPGAEADLRDRSRIHEFAAAEAARHHTEDVR